MSLRSNPAARYLRQKARHARAFLSRGSFLGKRGLKLNLGCGLDKQPGYVNVDASPQANADLFTDFRFLGRYFREGSVAEIKMIHSISYLNLWQAQALFQEFLRLLQAGGLLILELPDLGKCVAKIQSASALGCYSPDYLEGVRGLYAFGLDNLSAKMDYHPYAFGWSDWHLKEELEKIGFEVSIQPPQTHGHPWRDLRVEARKP